MKPVAGINLVPHSLRILRALTENREPMYASELMESSSTSRGTVYPALQRLQDQGFVSYSIEPPSKVFRMARPKYYLTAKGIEAFEQIARDFHVAFKMVLGK